MPPVLYTFPAEGAWRLVLPSLLMAGCANLSLLLDATNRPSTPVGHATASPPGAGTPVATTGPSAAATPARDFFRLVAPATASVGDALFIKVEKVESDGSTASLLPSEQVSWASPSSYVPWDTDPGLETSALPATSSPPTGLFIQGVLFILGDPAGPGTVPLSARIGGIAGVEASGAITVWPMPAGVAARGGITFAENCAICHGTLGQGIASLSARVGADGQANYGPGLNAAHGNVAGDPAWSKTFLAFAPRSDVDNLGVLLHTPMPNWLTKPSASGRFLTTSDFADIWAWLLTQTATSSDS